MYADRSMSSCSSSRDSVSRSATPEFSTEGNVIVREAISGNYIFTDTFDDATPYGWVIWQASRLWTPSGHHVPERNNLLYVETRDGVAITCRNINMGPYILEYRLPTDSIHVDAIDGILVVFVIHTPHTAHFMN